MRGLSIRDFSLATGEADMVWPSFQLAASRHWHDWRTLIPDVTSTTCTCASRRSADLKLFHTARQCDNTLGIPDAFAESSHEPLSP